MLLLFCQIMTPVIIILHNGAFNWLLQVNFNKNEKALKKKTAQEQLAAQNKITSLAAIVAAMTGT